MLYRMSFARSISLILCALMSFPTVAAESLVATLDAPRQVPDVQLREDGSMLGKLVDRQGQGLSDVDIQIHDRRGLAAAVKTDRQGVFFAHGLKPGELSIQIDGRIQKVRVWTADVAPPASSTAVMLVAGNAVRGQCCAPGLAPTGGACDDASQCCDPCCKRSVCKGLLARPWLLCVGVAAAIAVPIAIDHNDAS